ncbi:hypothetical protein D3C87_2051490 [compost metagenome]
MYRELIGELTAKIEDGRSCRIHQDAIAGMQDRLLVKLLHARFAGELDDQEQTFIVVPADVLARPLDAAEVLDHMGEV